jgi:hypothetical protein
MSRLDIMVAGLPAPVPQFNIVDDGGVWIARVDFAWPEFRIARV